MCTVSLSKPLLSLRPRKDLVETLLHEMIHAYLFVTQNNKDRDGHGPEFQKHMHRINSEAKTNITVIIISISAVSSLYLSCHLNKSCLKEHFKKIICSRFVLELFTTNDY